MVIACWRFEMVPVDTRVHWLPTEKLISGEHTSALQYEVRVVSCIMSTPHGSSCMTEGEYVCERRPSAVRQARPGLTPSLVLGLGFVALLQEG